MFDDDNRSHRISLSEALLGLLIAAECLINARMRGIVVSSDGDWYVSAANFLLAHHFNVFALYRAMPTNPPPFCYTLLPIIIAAAKALAPASWRAIVVVINAAATAGAGMLTFRLAHRWMSRAGAVVVAAGFLGGFEIVDWSRYVLTDSLFLGIAAVAMYLLVTAVVCNERRRAAAAFGVIALAFITRPVAPLLLVPFVLVLAALWKTRRGEQASAEVRWLTVRFIALTPWVLLALVGALTFIAARHVAVPELTYVITLYKTGTVIVGRPEMRVHPGSGFLFFMTTMLRRLVVFFAISARGFSTVHSLMNAIYYVPVYITAAGGIVTLFLKRRVQEAEQLVGYIVLVMACAIWLNHAIAIIDFDWRYRLPIMPALLLLSAFGVTHLMSMRDRFAAEAEVKR